MLRFEDLFGKPRDPRMHFFTSETRFPSYFGEKPADFQEQCRLNRALYRRCGKHPESHGRDNTKTFDGRLQADRAKEALLGGRMR